MLLKIYLLSLALSSLVESAEIDNFFKIRNYETIEQKSVFRPNPCTFTGARQFEPNPRGCSWFWECKDENNVTLTQPREAKCPFDLHFQINPPACVYPNEKVTPCTYDYENNLATPQKCTPWNPMQLIPHQFECNKFRLCWENTTVFMDCPAGLHFSYFDNECVDPYLADCRSLDNYCKSFGNLKLKRNPLSCTKYHICSQCNNRYELIEFECTKGTHHYNDVLNHCDLGGCEDPETDPNPNLPEPLTIECQSLAFSATPHPNDPTSRFYFYCSNGRSFLAQCPENTVFHPERRGCFPHSNYPGF